MYGLKKAPRLFQDHLVQVLKDLGFTRLKSDPNVFVHFLLVVILLVYVDDFILFGTLAVCLQVLELLKEHFLLKVTGQLNEEGDSLSFIGRQLKRVGNSVIFAGLEGYLDAIVAELGLTNAKPTSTTGNATLKGNDQVEELSSALASLYRRIVG